MVLLVRSWDSAVSASPDTAAERVNLATHVFVGRAQTLQVRKLVGGKLSKVQPEPDSTGINTDLVFEFRVLVDEVLFPAQWKPEQTIRIIYGGGAFSTRDSRKAFVTEHFIYLTRVESLGGQAYFSASYPWHLVEQLGKREEVEAALEKRVTRLPLLAHPQDERSEVGTFLRNLHQWQLGKSRPQPRVGDLNHLGDAALPLLAGFLTDRDLGNTAERVMVEIDPDRAAPLIFASMPEGDSAISDIDC